MSIPNKSLDKSKRYAGVKVNDFVNKTRANEANRSTVRPQGWTNLGKINSRRIPPPANLPSLKSETGVNSPTLDPTITTNHGWTSNENQTPITTRSNSAQQQLDPLIVNSSTLLTSVDIEKPRIAPMWSTVTASTNPNINEQIPSLLPLNDFPHLAAAAQEHKTQSESVANIQNPSFRPANLATWKEGDVSRVNPLSNDLSRIIPNNPGANIYQQQISNSNIRIHSPQMWAYNPYTPVPLLVRQQQHLNTFNDYKSPTILRNKDIDDLSKLTDNTWANASPEVNYEEKIRFSDDDDDHHHCDVGILDSNNTSHRINSQVLQHSRLIQDDEHLKQIQDDKNCELINALTIAKQRRDEQERHLKNEQLISNTDEQKQIPGYQTRPLLTSNDQENINSQSPWQIDRDTSNTSRTCHDKVNSHSSFAMKNWSDQMDSFNYGSLHEKTDGYVEDDEPCMSKEYSRSHSESSTPSQHNNVSVSRKMKNYALLSKKQQKSSSIQTKSSKKLGRYGNADYYDNPNNQQINLNEQWENWKDSTDNYHQTYSNDNRRRQQLHSYDLSTQKSNSNKQLSTEARGYDRQQTNSRSKIISSSLNKNNQTMNNKPTNNKNQSVRRPISPNRLSEPADDPTLKEYKSQQRTHLNDHKQRYQTASTSVINTASIPPLMSVRSDATVTTNLYKPANHAISSHYGDDNIYYDPSLETRQNYRHSNLHHRKYTALESYGRYRRSGTLRHQQQHASYNIHGTSSISSAPNTSSRTRQNKKATNRKTNQSADQEKSPIVSKVKSSLIRDQATIGNVPVTKQNEPSVSSSTIELSTIDGQKSNDAKHDSCDQKTSIKNENESNTILQTENESKKTNKKKTMPTLSSLSNSKRRTNKNRQTYHQDQRYQSQQVSRYRNSYSRSMQEYEAVQMSATPNYYGATHQTAHNSRNAPIHELSSGYYYDHPQQHYNKRFSYSNQRYQQQHSTNKSSKRGNLSAVNNQQQAINGSNNNNLYRQSVSDNDQKEGEEWETASESSTNIRNDYCDINTKQTNETKSINRGRTSAKKSFSSQRPNARQIFKYTNT